MEQSKAVLTRRWASWLVREKARQWGCLVGNVCVCLRIGWVDGVGW